MTTLMLSGVSKRYADGRVGLYPLDLAVADGEFVVVVGPSGCGKSTLLRIVAGFERPTTGTVAIDGRCVDGLGPRERNLAMVSQQAWLYPTMTIAQNIGFPLRVAGTHVRERARRVEEIARLLDLVDVLDDRPSKVSGGQEQRAAIGRAIIRGSRLLLMDEPMSNLDAKLRTELRTQLLRLHRRVDATTMYVTHDQVEAMSMGDRIVVLRGGRVAQRGTPLEIYERPVDTFVARFMGSPPMAIVAVTLGGGDGDVRPRLRVGRQEIVVPERELARRPELARRFRRIGHASETIGIGLRAEAVRLDPNGQLVGSPSYVEALGSEQLVHVSIAADRLDPLDDRRVVDVTTGLEDRAIVAVAAPTSATFSLWEPVRLAVDVGRIHTFDATTGRRFV